VRATTWPLILLATTNAGKVREIVDTLAGLPVRLLTLADLSVQPTEPDETGTTFAENAAIKARAYAYATGLPTVAEDSGLAIDALGGRPGVHSARYPGTDYPAKFRHLYVELAPHARPWTARFVGAVAFVVPDAGVEPGIAPVAFACEGTVEGEIADEPTGTNGFGYDPIFIYPPYGTTLGNVDDRRKLAVSHRGAAFRQFRAWLEEHSA